MVEIPLIYGYWETVSGSTFLIFLLIFFSYPLGLALEIVNRVTICSIVGSIIGFAISNTLCGIISGFIVGTLIGIIIHFSKLRWEVFLCFFSGYFRRSSFQIKRAYEEVYGKDTIGGERAIQDKYNKAWYHNYPNKKALSDIDIMEAQLAFMRIAIIPILCLLVYFLGTIVSSSNLNTCCCCNLQATIEKEFQLYLVGILSFTIVSYLFLIPKKQHHIYKNIFLLEKYKKN